MYRIFATALMAVTFLQTAFAQQTALPPHTVEGCLRNGMRYIVMNNDLPRHTVEVRLVMGIGSLQENDDQLGGAHFLEHMVFKGVKPYPDRALVDYFERQGMKYGRDINAFTGFDRTIFWFTLPTFYDADRIIDTTFVAVHHILSDLLFREERVRKERGIIVEELRGYSTGDDFYNLKIGNGRHVSRMPLGDEDDIMRIDRQRLMDFYQRWYAPQFATLVVVGDVDAPQMAQRIEQQFADLVPHGAKRAATWPLSYPKGAQMMTVSDSLGSDLKLDLMVPHHYELSTNLKTTVEQQRDRMLERVVSKRLRRARTECMVSNQWYLADKSHFALTFSAREKDSLLCRLTRAAAEVNDLARHGLTEAELKEAIEDCANGLFCDTLKAVSSKWCEDFIERAILGSCRIYTAADAEVVKAGIRQTTARQLQQRAKGLLADMKRHLLLAYSNNASQPLTKEEVLLAWERGKTTPALPYVASEQEEQEPLFMAGQDFRKHPLPPILAQTHEPQDSAVASRRYYADLRLTEVNLRNGVRLLLRPTDDEDSRIQLLALGKGGTSSLADNDYYQLRDAVAYMDMGGIDTVDPDTLIDVMGDHNVMMNVGLDNEWHQLMATAEAADAQLMMNLVYEKMHHPRKDYEDFEDSRQSELESWGQETVLGRMIQRDPNRQISNSVDSVVGNITQRRPMQPADLKALNLDSMDTYYRRLYTNPQGLTLILTGHYDLATVERVAIGTFARMQAPDSVMAVNDEPVQPVRSFERQFPHTNPTQTVFNHLFAGNYYPSLRATLMFKLMRDLLQQRMLSVLRERENIVYSPYCDMVYHGLPQRTYYFWLCFAVKNENTARADAALREIVTDLQTRPVPAVELEKLKRSFCVTKRQQLSDVAPSEWKDCLATLLKNGEELEDFDHYDEVLGSITPEEVQKAFCDYIDIDNHIVLYQKQDQ